MSAKKTQLIPRIIVMQRILFFLSENGKKILKMSTIKKTDPMCHCEIKNFIFWPEFLIHLIALYFKNV